MVGSDVAAPEAPGRPRRVLVVDDHVVFAELLSMAFDAEPGLECVGHAQSAEAAYRLVEELHPDVVTMDLQLPETDGLTATAHLVEQHPDLLVLILTAHAARGLVARVADSGAVGVVPKDGSVANVLSAIRSARRGVLLLPPDLVSDGSERDDAAQPPSSMRLTAREHEVLGLLARGQDPRVISRTMGISLNTARGHLKNVMAKLNVHSQLEAVVVASRAGLVRLDDTS